MDTLIVASLAFPLVLAALVALPSCRPAALSLAPWAPLPALALAARAEPSLDLPGVLLGITLGLDATGRLFLAFTALVWLIAGVFARGWLGNDARPVRYWVFWLLTLTGNLGVCLALDAVSFYLAFALMSFAAYGLIVHPGSAEARRAGRVYLTMAVLGETALVMGLILAVQGAGAHAFTALAAAPANAAAAWLLIVGFGIKLGVPLLHMWLPLAHPVAPVPASAVLSGVMLKAGLLGLLRGLPLGTQALPEAGSTLVLAGVAAMFLGAAAGLMQRNPKVLLAYSSVSQMGYLSLGVGAGLLAPAAWPLLLPALGLYALHHALAKSTLFLGVGLIQAHGVQRVRLVLLGLPALALAGAPLTSGALAKDALKAALDGLHGPGLALATHLLPLAALATALLMARLLWLAWRLPTPNDTGAAPRGIQAPWVLAMVASATLPWGLVTHAARADAFELATLVAATWPLLAAAGLGMAAVALRVRAPELPPGDLLHPLARLFRRPHATSPHGRFPAVTVRLPRMPGLPTASSAIPKSVRAGALWLALLILLTLTLAR